ncbi:hypothetical protein BG74_02685 [Sodalis-like endosymbiont of Proechinophthirus fluctus]|nr:hypothetical protein BG74_02685 [Sodalis-like endosymbiont of Proechinophthirus fluctus]
MLQAVYDEPQLFLTAQQRDDLWIVTLDTPNCSQRTLSPDFSLFSYNFSEFQLLFQYHEQLYMHVAILDKR